MGTAIATAMGGAIGRGMAGNGRELADDGGGGGGGIGFGPEVIETAPSWKLSVPTELGKWSVTDRLPSRGF